MKALITGHAQFANGMKSALELIAGPQEELQVLPFDESTILDEFQNLLVNFFSMAKTIKWYLLICLGARPSIKPC